jgi:hypothetical protein
MLVQGLTGTDPEDEPAVQEKLRGCCGLGQDRWMNPDRWAGDARHDLV